jgi:hypothetical protein
MFGFVERVVIPTLVIFLLVGGLCGALLGAALIWRSNATLRFVGRMNQWVSPTRALRTLDTPRSLEGPSARLRRWLGAFLVLGGAFSVVCLIARLHFQRGGYMPGVDLERWIVSGVALQTMKWLLVVGGAFAFAVGLAMLFSPQRLSAFEERMNRWYSSRRLVNAEERMHMPLEPRVEAHPRAAGSVIAVASVLVAAAMAVLLFGKMG